MKIIVKLALKENWNEAEIEYDNIPNNINNELLRDLIFDSLLNNLMKVKIEVINESEKCKKDENKENSKQENNK
jgi:hypothetical protein